MPSFIATCQTVQPFDKKKWWLVRNCKLGEGFTLDDVVNNLAEQQDQYAHCGGFGPWIVDEQGNIMGRYRNPACPKGTNAHK